MNPAFYILVAGFFNVWEEFVITAKERTLATIAGKYDPSTDTGYYGFVESDDFINGDELAEQLKFKSGFGQKSHAGWLKFYVGPNAICNSAGIQRIFYVAKMPLRYHVSWDEINNDGLIDGSRCVTVGKNTYSVRLLTGGRSKPGTGSEWNELIYRVYHIPPAGRIAWDSFGDSELNISAVSGRYTWTQEKTNSSAVYRGKPGITYWLIAMTSFAGTNYGWRPVLERVFD